MKEQLELVALREAQEQAIKSMVLMKAASVYILRASSKEDYKERALRVGADMSKIDKKVDGLLESMR